MVIYRRSLLKYSIVSSLWRALYDHLYVTVLYQGYLKRKARLFVALDLRSTIWNAVTFFSLSLRMLCQKHVAPKHVYESELGRIIQIRSDALIFEIQLQYSICTVGSNLGREWNVSEVSTCQNVSEVHLIRMSKFMP